MAHKIDKIRPKLQQFSELPQWTKLKLALQRLMNKDESTKKRNTKKTKS